ncbi:hypothetical protein G9A89_005228 [Geosiphon pyriformis]|nr:hypothetical protein G9A89_005228 [Geosiphon pyriformis]
MSIVNITDIKVLDNPALFSTDFSFEITFECITELQDDLEWKVIYVGSPEGEEHDQVLDSIMVGPVPAGVNKFVFQTPPADHTKIPPNDILGVTVIIITCSFRNQEFVRVGYYVNNEYIDEELRENPPEEIQLEKLYKNILADKPRVTRLRIKWDLEGDEPMADVTNVGMTQEPESQQQESNQLKGESSFGFFPSSQPATSPSSTDFGNPSSLTLSS